MANAITVYETKDGKRFDCEADAERHERLQAAHNDAFEKHACYGKFEFSDDQEFADFVCKYAEMINIH